VCGTLDCMVRTTIYLPDELKRALEEKARREGRTEADIVRDSLEKTLRPSAKRPWKAVFNSGHHDVSERVEEFLADGFGQA
jgi:predicted transcriptional regulator